MTFTADLTNVQFIKHMEITTGYRNKLSLNFTPVHRHRCIVVHSARHKQTEKLRTFCGKAF